ncbi:MAG TPA: glycosyltransferase, partial [Acidobacteria bacterium]|nr:glycosyltransferase [Acidobacteriota bacterium]
MRRTEAELERIYGSPEWRRLHRWRRLQVEANVWRHRLLHPVDTARTVASRLLPAAWRLRLVRLLRQVRGERQERAAGGPAVPPPAAAPRGGEQAPRPTILCLPVIEWSFRRQRPQQLLERLAARGWPVLYAALEFEVGATRATVAPDELAPGVRRLVLPAGREIGAGAEPLGVEDTRLAARAISKLRDREDLDAAVILCQSPFWFPLARVLHRAFGWPLVYDRMDLHEGFASTYAGIGEDDRRLQEEADLVLASSRVLAEDSREHARRVVHLPNGCDWTTWESAPASTKLDKLPRPIIGYYGAISSWFDTELVVSLALARPAWSFVLIGSTWDADTSRLEQLPNVHLLGEIPYAELPAFAAAFDAAILPRKRLPLTEAMEPVKLYEMLALGLDVVAPPLASLDVFEGLIRIADGPEAFLAVLEEVLRH